VTEAFEANRRLWEEWAALHPQTEFYDLDSFRRGGVRVRDYEIEHVGPVEGKELLHLHCHFGIDSLSWARLGANVTGVDYSANAIATATALAAELGLEARFIQSDIYKLPEVLEGEFDCVYASRGVISWLPDLDPWMAVVARFLKPGGIFYLNEIHPLTQIFDDEGPTEPVIRFPYFERAEPLRFKTEGSYADPTADIKEKFVYGWNHSLGEIVTSVAGAGLRLELLQEFPFLEWPLPFLEEREGAWWLPDGATDLPLSFSLKATKPS
jgi:ubiquinone/menaquinone biosynthesis C-methylase UbiE